jgi:hypothetical protein
MELPKLLVLPARKDIPSAIYVKVWRRDRDSNPGYLAVYTLSKRAPSATRPSLRGIADLFESNTVERRSEGGTPPPSFREPAR